MLLISPVVLEGANEKAVFRGVETSVADPIISSAWIAFAPVRH
ncbi:hypothetical protein DSM3645_02913 [Blastopirellula marina DSM 3645]|uniref:Uncharacterized protein n=1 Tax=Blastopirellula marina DSM 3645 TaxID=314230 RepID=A3ZVP6_9BACT|nr:hypothetical protein DSM3645_02913 [Blastopirellula marina DSM 3645]